MLNAPESSDTTNLQQVFDRRSAAKLCRILPAEHVALKLDASPQFRCQRSYPLKMHPAIPNSAGSGAAPGGLAFLSRDRKPCDPPYHELTRNLTVGTAAQRAIAFVR